MWMTDVIDLNLDGRIDQADYLSWEEAKTLCDSLNAKGFDDWRLPTIEELASLHHIFGAIVVRYWDIETPLARIWSAWSSTSVLRHPESAWVATLADVVDGSFYPQPKDIRTANVLPVRNPVAP
jgi:hypothetical protein